MYEQQCNGYFILTFHAVRTFYLYAVIMITFKPCKICIDMKVQCAVLIKKNKKNPLLNNLLLFFFVENVDEFLVNKTYSAL